MTLEIYWNPDPADGVIGLFRTPPFIIYFFFCFTLLGAAAAFVLTSLGGTNISPAHLLLGFLTLKLLSDERFFKASAREVSIGRPGFWLMLTVIYSVIGAYYLPRLLAGQTLTYAVRAESPFSSPLAPAMSNLNQSADIFYRRFYMFYRTQRIREHGRWKKGVGKRSFGLRHTEPYFWRARSDNLLHEHCRIVFFYSQCELCASLRHGSRRPEANCRFLHQACHHSLLRRSPISHSRAGCGCWVSGPGPRCRSRSSFLYLHWSFRPLQRLSSDCQYFSLLAIFRFC